MEIASCFRSGFCCKRGVCPYGEWDSEKSQCSFLEEDAKIGEAQTYRCGIYEHIQKQPGANFSPAFGAGCCSPLFNEDRTRIIKELTNVKKRIVPEVHSREG